MKPIKIRDYQPEDLENIVQLWYGTWHQTFPHLQHPQTYSEWKQKFYELAENGDIFVTEVENSIAGFAVILTKEQCLSQLFVDKNYQNLGIGSALLNVAKRLCPQGLNLYTLQENLKARAFYEKHGFQARKFSINEFNGQPNVEYYWEPEPVLASLSFNSLEKLS
ncbi:GCN5-related N-acetyltransferase (plasmid) [Cylindrospermum sp. NIES-4074]|nr:GCN5-related N-acetyltransferase [Cylindrospermum sp. NIES-4074]